VGSNAQAKIRVNIGPNFMGPYQRRVREKAT
jgi:hypothetical protein